MNNSLVEYLCDGGADRSIINKSVYENICRQQPTTKLLKYQGKALRSCTGEIEILGIVKLDRCMLSSESNGLLKGVEIIVTNHSSSNECLLGRDIINMVPKLKSQMDSMKNIITEWSNEIANLY